MCRAATPPWTHSSVSEVPLPWILNFAVKNDWKQPSRLDWVEACLQRFVKNYQRLGISSIAFPWLGAMNGGLPWADVHALMRSYLEPLDDIDIELIEFDESAPDPLFLRLRHSVQTTAASVFCSQLKITRRAADLVYQAILEQEVTSLSRLCSVPGLGKTTIERLYESFRSIPETAPALEPTLFDGITT